MNNQTINSAIHRQIGILFVIVKRGWFYRPDAKGYCSNIEHAWKLPEEQAKQHARPNDCEPVTIRPEDTPDFCGSLDAMARAEHWLLAKDIKLARKYAEHLRSMVADKYHSMPDAGGFAHVTAEPDVRAKTFIEVLGIPI